MAFILYDRVYVVRNKDDLDKVKVGPYVIGIYKSRKATIKIYCPINFNVFNDVCIYTSSNYNRPILNKVHQFNPGVLALCHTQTKNNKSSKFSSVSIFIDSNFSLFQLGPPSQQRIAKEVKSEDSILFKSPPLNAPSVVSYKYNVDYCDLLLYFQVLDDKAPDRAIIYTRIGPDAHVYPNCIVCGRRTYSSTSFECFPCNKDFEYYRDKEIIVYIGSKYKIKSILNNVNELTFRDIRNVNLYPRDTMYYRTSIKYSRFEFCRLSSFDMKPVHDLIELMHMYDYFQMAKVLHLHLAGCNDFTISNFMRSGLGLQCKIKSEDLKRMNKTINRVRTLNEKANLIYEKLNNTEREIYRCSTDAIQKYLGLFQVIYYYSDL